MFKLRIVRARAHVRSQEEMDGILGALHMSGYTPLLVAIEKAATNLIGLPLGINTVRRMLSSSYRGYSEIIGDLFIKDDQALLLRTSGETT